MFGEEVWVVSDIAGGTGCQRARRDKCLLVFTSQHHLTTDVQEVSPAEVIHW